MNNSPSAAPDANVIYLSGPRLGRLRIGMEVGGRRWPYLMSHPDAWLKPWKGVILAQNDPMAWSRCMLFGTRIPEQHEIDKHVSWCHSNGLLSESIPVLWDFGTEQKVYWEKITSLSTYEIDCLDWAASRERAYALQAPIRRAG